MTQKAAYFAPITNILGSINHAISGLFFEQRESARKTNADTSSYANFDSVDFSKPDQSELFIHEEDIDPLVEAEVYAIYGRLNDAEKVLDSALKAGLVTVGEVSLFWSIRQTVKTPQRRRAQ